MKAADMVLLNGKVYSITQENSRVTGTAVAVRDGKILQVGNDELIKTYINNETEVIDCQGNTILPGLCDAHCHPSIAASVGAGCDLFSIYRQEDESADEVIDKYLERLKAFVEEHPEKSLIRGTGWVLGNFSDDRMPTRHDIDKICSDRPVVLESFCQHNLWVNSKAIELAGVDENTPDVQAGRIYREENGYPEGVFNDPEAMAMIKNNVPGYDLSVEEYKEGIMYYQKEYANKYGVTFVQDCMHSDNARAAYVELAKEGKLTARFRGVYMLEPAGFKEQLLMAALRKGEDNVGEDFRIETIKIFAEGMFIDWSTHWSGGYFGEAAQAFHGKERWDSMYDFREFIEAGGVLGFSSDVFSYQEAVRANPFFGMQTAMTRVDPVMPLDPDRYPGSVRQPEGAKYTLEQLLQGYTRNNAVRMRLFDKMGSIEKGKLANLIVLEKDIFTVPAEEVSSIKPECTYFEGKERRIKSDLTVKRG